MAVISFVRCLLPLALVASTAACATILDFQTPVDKVTAAATSDAGIAETSAEASAESQDAATPLVAPARDLTSAPLPDAGSCACIPMAPVEWSGPFVVAISDDTAAACSGDYELEAYFGQDGPQADPAICGCSCGDPGDVACSAPAASYFAGSACGTTACHVGEGPLTCDPVGTTACDGTSTKAKSMTFSVPTPSGGACAPIPVVRVPAVTWKSSIRLCASAKTVGTCAGGVCQPPPGPLFSGTNRCVTKAGDNECPSAFPIRKVFHEDGNDTRACTACKCGAPSGVTCDASVMVSSNTQCSKTDSTPAPGDCVALSNSTRATAPQGTPKGGSCSAAGGEPMGGFVETEPTTVCCLE